MFLELGHSSNDFHVLMEEHKKVEAPPPPLLKKKTTLRTGGSECPLSPSVNKVENESFL